MKDNGGTAKLMVRANSPTPTEISTKANGKMTKQKDMARTATQMEQCTEVNGSVISSMAKELRRGLTEQAMKEAIKLVRSMERVGLVSLMALSTVVLSRLTKLTGLDAIPGLIQKIT